MNSRQKVPLISVNFVDIEVLAVVGNKVDKTDD